MKLTAKITDISTVNELDIYWKSNDYINLLKEFDYPDADQLKPGEILEYLHMAITDFEPSEAAEHLLKYKLSDKLNEGQIQNLSHEMIEDKIAEEYPDPSLHFDLFNINQLLFKSFNGTFPNTEATIIKIEFLDENLPEINKEIITKTLSAGLKDNNLINRLFEDQITGKEAFGDASNVIWHIKNLGDKAFEIVTSKYWIDKEDFQLTEFEAAIAFYEEEES